MIFVFGLVLVGEYYTGIVNASSIPNFTTTPISSCAVNLSWTYNGGQSGDIFAIDRNPPVINSDRNSSILQSGDEDSIPGVLVGTNNYTTVDKYVPPNGTYSYRVLGWRGDNYVSSNINSVTTVPITGPTPTPSLTLFNRIKDGSRIDLEWSAVNFNPIAYGQYEITRAEASGPSWVFGNFGLIGTIPAMNGVTLWGDGGLDVAKSYKYQIVARQSDEGCNPADTSTITSSEVAIPTDVSDVVTANYDFSTNKITVGWTGYSDPGYFEIWRAKGEDVFSKIDVVNQSGVREYDDIDGDGSPLENNTTYRYQVRKCNNSNVCSAFSDEVSAIVANAPQQPEVRVTYANYIASSGVGSVYVSWKNTFPGATYVVSRKDVGSGDIVENIVEMGSINPNVMIFYQDKNVPIEKIYDYTICASLGYDGICESEDSIPVRVNLNIYRILRGAAWALASEENGQHGIGWVSFNRLDLDEICHFPKKQTGDPDWCDGWNNKPVDYSIQIDEKGLISGAGWASAVDDDGQTVGWGWLSFNKADLDKCPDNNQTDCAAKIIDMGCITGDVCNIRGWGRFIGAVDDNSDWDGWVSLSNKKISAGAIDGKNFAKDNSAMITLAQSWQKLKTDASSFALASIGESFYNFVKSFIKATYAAKVGPKVNVTYGISYRPTDKRVSGLGWGGAIVGWVAMNDDNNGDGTIDCLHCDVRSVNRKPTVSNVQIIEGVLEPSRSGGVWCALIPEYLATFNYSDPDKDDAAQANIKFYYNNLSLALTTTTPVVSCASDTTCSVPIPDPLGFVQAMTGNLYPGSSYLQPNTTYSIKVSVADGIGGETMWSDIVSSSGDNKERLTPDHYNPFAQFDWDGDLNVEGKQNPVVGGVTGFMDDTQDGVGSDKNWPAEKWLWTFKKGNTTKPEDQNTTAILYELPSNATLQVTDDDGHTCALTKGVTGTGGGGSGEPVKRRIFRER